VKRDIDRLMQERGIDVAVVTGAVKGNATMYYMVNGAGISHAIVIKKRGEEPVLLCGTMEREEAAASGLKTIDTSKYNIVEMIKESGGDRLAASVKYYQAIFEEFGVKGRVAFYGLGDVGRNWEFLKALDEGLSDVTVTGEFIDDIFITARMTKGSEEIDRIRVVGKKTCEVVGHIADFMKSHKTEGKTLVKDDGTPLTIGDCKAEIKMALAKRKIIMTRTFVLGEASQEILDSYKTLEECYDAVASTLEMGEDASVYQTRACDFFEARGIETPRTDPNVRNGYVHSLGHGIGLNVHEKPTLSNFTGNTDKLVPGSIFTVEPGLYYPDKGYGMRIEDVYYVHEDGTVENVTDFPRGLVLEV